MIDSYGRNIDYIRISVTDRCDLRCIYCMPAEGLPLTAHGEVLTYGEITHICKLMAGLGFHKVKLTGGEPLVRKDLSRLVKRLKEIDGIDNVTLTTNAVLLADQMDELYHAGIDAINISLDTLNPELFGRITRRDYLDKVKLGIETALKYPSVTLKINCVPLGIPEQDLTEVASLAKDNRLHVRFIEMMPIGNGKNFNFISEEGILSMLEEKYGKAVPYSGKLGNGPCHYYEFDGFCGRIGFISAISHKFCSECNRVRLTSQGFLKTCLQYDKGNDLKTMLRDGTGDEEIIELIKRTIDEKPIGHRFLEESINQENSLNMSQIGG